MTRRNFISLMAAPVLFGAESGPKIAITMDDVSWQSIPEPFPAQANARILAALREHGSIHAALFAVGRNVDNDTGRAILRSWSNAGHFIGNHTYSHQMYSRMGEAAFEEDILHCERILAAGPGFRKFFRYPALKEGDTVAKRDGTRAFLREHDYRVGHVTIDASDWYYDARLRARLKGDASFDVARYREPYLDHMWDRAVYYDDLARKVLGRSVPHTVLVHYNLLNSLFLGDLLDMYRSRGWKLIDAEVAFADPVFERSPLTLPAGESLIWALAKESGRFEGELRYPGEDDVYERPKLDRLGL